jgi:hypothetical protein
MIAHKPIIAKNFAELGIAISFTDSHDIVKLHPVFVVSRNLDKGFARFLNLWVLGRMTLFIFPFRQLSRPFRWLALHLRLRISN